MSAIIAWIEAVWSTLPLPLLEVWGRFAYLVGFVLAVAAFGGFTFRPGGRWGFGREQQAWDSKAILSIPLTFVIILVSGYLGSFIVLVPGAQTFESLKDLMVFLCVVLFGYPALITVPFAYGLSDLIEGVPPGFLLDWLPGYFINPACFWMAYQLIGRDPDFRRTRTWGMYLLFVLLFLALEPVLWGFICAGKFTAVISYRKITSALFFTTGLTWTLAPFAMMVALPLARRLKLFWAEIPGHVRERAIGGSTWLWTSGEAVPRPVAVALASSWPLRMIILAPFIALVLLMVGATALVTLRSAERDADKLATRLHEEIGGNIALLLDVALGHPAHGVGGLREMLRHLPVARHGIAMVVDDAGRTVASSAVAGDAVAARAVAGLRRELAGRAPGEGAVLFRFDHITEEPITRTTWLARGAPYPGHDGEGRGWVVLTVMPESYYLAGVKVGNSRSAMVFSVALLLSLGVAAVLAAVVTAGLRRTSLAATALAGGDLTRRAPDSRLVELGTLAGSFNEMAERLAGSIADLRAEVEVRKGRERELEVSEARSRSSEHRLQLATRGAKLSIWDWDIETDRLTWDDSMFELYGVRREEFDGTFEAWAARVDPEDRARATADVEAALRGEREFTSEFRVRSGDASERVVAGVAQTIRGADGRALRMVGINWDVTERRRRDQQLAEEKRLVDSLMDSLPGVVFLVDAGDRFVKWNQEFERVTGYAREEIGGLCPVDVAPAAGGDALEKLVGVVRARGHDALECGLLTKDGRSIPHYFKGVLLTTERGPCVLGVGIDVSDRRRLEEQFRQSQKMEAVGHLASGVAHDFNNLLTIILGCSADYTTMAQGDPLRGDFEAIHEAGRRAAQLTRQLLAFSRQSVLRTELLSLNTVVRDTEPMLRRLIGEDVRLSTELAADLEPITADLGQLGQVLLNLSVNARDAMQEGGSITIATRNVRIDAEYCALRPEAKPGAYVRLDVTDTGCGMGPEVQSRVFEPFFTTKPAGKGTGLGLAMVYGLVKQGGGHIEVASEVGRGTTFMLYFPVSAGAPSARPGSAPEAPVAAGTETVLIAEDEEAVRRLAARALTARGYTVLVAGDGEEALRVVEDHGGRVDMLVTDVVMPAMSGSRLAEALRARFEGLEVLFVSGYADDAVVRQGLLRDEIDFLQKPYTAAELGRRVREILDGRGRAKRVVAG